MFDPYHKWLGIPPKDQPPDFYRLLSLQLFESDLEVIESAVDRTMGFVRQYQSGEHAAHAAKLLNEIARARICLLKPATKSEYDAKLKSKSSNARAAVTEPDSSEIDWESVEVANAPKRPSVSRTKKSKRNGSPAMPWIAGSVAAVIVVIAVLIVSKSGTSTTPAVVATPPEVAEGTQAKPTSASAPSTPSSSMPPVAIAPATKEKAELPGVHPVLVSARTPLAFEKPGFEDWARSLGGIPVSEQVDAVSQKLRELNPGFDGTLKRHLIQEVAVTELEFSSDQITDISPVRALPQLMVLRCDGSYSKTDGAQGKLTDLSPLNGMKISRFACSNSKKLDDLSPLQGMPLIELYFESTSVSDLRPLRNMSLHTLAFFSTRVSDLTPLIGMPLNIIYSANNPITDLSPVQGMELTTFSFSGTNVTDVTPLQGMNLSEIAFSPEKITKGIEIVRGMTKLKWAWMRGARLPADEFWKKYDAGEFAVVTTDAATKAQGMVGVAAKTNPIPPDASSTKVGAGTKNVQSVEAAPREPLAFEKPGFDVWIRSLVGLSPERLLEAVSKKLQELNPGFDGKFKRYQIQKDAVTELEFSTDQITDISPVKALLKLKVLRCVGSYGTNFEKQGKLTDLSPLTGMKLTHFSCSVSKNLKDLSPLEGLPLVELVFESTGVSDLIPLRGMTHLRLVAFSSTKVSDLMPLSGLPIKILACANNQISDLSPLQEMDLSLLNFAGTNVTDLSPLKKLNLTDISFSPAKITKGIEIVREMTTLKRAFARGEYIPVAEFWKSYDAGEFSKPSP